VSGLERNKALIRRYYEEMWNQWDLSLAEELLAPGLKFRGSLGTETEGIRAFCRYARSVWTGFPDFHNEIRGIVAEGDVVVARVVYTGTHRGDVLGVAATGRPVCYEGVAWFRIEGGLIAEVDVMADREGMMRQLTLSSPGTADRLR
jgi:steroid delta-isomerase-like uncharacterized protein